MYLRCQKMGRINGLEKTEEEILFGSEHYSENKSK
jgi:hypothetical protein